MSDRMKKRPIKTNDHRPQQLIFGQLNAIMDQQHQVTVHFLDDAGPHIFKGIPEPVYRQFLETMLQQFAQYEDSDFISAEQFQAEVIASDDNLKAADPKNQHVALYIRGRRKANGWTQAELADKLSVDQSQVSSMENGKKTIGKRMAIKLADIFNSDPKMFLTDI